MNDFKALLKVIFCIMLAIGLAACGSSSSSNGNGHKKGHYTIGVTVSGLEGSGLVLLHNVSDTLTINTNGFFVFNSTAANGEAYDVEVLHQPSDPVQTCTVNHGTGTVQGADVTDITVICSGEAYTVGGTATGITNTVVLQNNGGDDLTLTADGPFTFSAPVANTAGYDVTLLLTSGLGCKFTNATGIVNGSGVTDVALSCISVTVSALYPTNGANWNDYVKNDGGAITNATDAVCNAGSDTSCLHGGEMRVVDVPSESSCSGVTMSESLGAFDWTCDDSTGSVRFISTGLKDGKHLSDLINFATTDWEKESVTVTVGADSFTTAPAKWWSNPVVEDNDGGSLSTAGTIYVVTGTAVTSDYTINASSVGLVGEPGAIMNADVSSSSMILANSKNFLWLEGVVNSGGANNNGVFLNNVHFSRLDNLKSNLSNYNGIVLNSSKYNTFSGVTASNNGYEGIYLILSSNNTFSGITTSNNGKDGVYIYSSSDNNTFMGVTVSNNAGNGVYLNASSNNNTLADVTASNNGAAGVYIYDLSSSNAVVGVTASNNGTMGAEINSNANNNTLIGVAAANNGWHGIYANNSWYATISNIAASNNASSGVKITGSSENYLTGLLKVGNNLYDCVASGGANPGLVNTTCTTAGTYDSGGLNGYGFGNSSDATLYNGVSLETSFVGIVNTDDSVNASDINGTASYPLPATFDWTNFENQYRAWGLDGTFGTSNSQGRWTTGLGAIWDWSLKITGDSGDNGGPALIGVLDLPTGNDTLTQIWNGTAADQSACDTLMPGSVFMGANDCETTFLRNAVEISGTGGNDNLLCESGETCLYTPNIGSYQGHGNLVSAGNIGTGGTLQNITLMEYDLNGR